MKIAGVSDTSVTGSEKTVYFAFSYRDLLWLVLVQFVSFESQETSRPFTSGSTSPPFYGLQGRKADDFGKMAGETDRWFKDHGRRVDYTKGLVHARDRRGIAHIAPNRGARRTK